jgi:hypothetical protein
LQAGGLLESRHEVSVSRAFRLGVIVTCFSHRAPPLGIWAAASESVSGRPPEKAHSAHVDALIAIVSSLLRIALLQKHLDRIAVTLDHEPRIA